MLTLILNFALFWTKNEIMSLTLPFNVSRYVDWSKCRVTLGTLVYMIMVIISSVLMRMRKKSHVEVMCSQLFVYCYVNFVHNWWEWWSPHLVSCQSEVKFIYFFIFASDICQNFMHLLVILHVYWWGIYCQRRSRRQNIILEDSKCYCVRKSWKIMLPSGHKRK